MEISNEISEITTIINEWSKSYSKEIKKAINYKKILPKTNVASIDLLLEQLQHEAITESIEFDLKIDCSLNNLIDTSISKDNLEALIGDHIKDAIIAVKHSNNENKYICASFEINNNAYEFSIYDSGVMFEIDTLVKLGTQPITTYEDNGGSGLGFFNTFKILDEHKTSLHIVELNFENSNFSKCIKFRFDGKKQYIIVSKRANDIKQADNNVQNIMYNVQ